MNHGLQKDSWFRIEHQIDIYAENRFIDGQVLDLDRVLTAPALAVFLGDRHLDGCSICLVYMSTL